MAMVLKDYQQRALGALDAFLARARGQRELSQMQSAFDAARRDALGDCAPAASYRPFAADAPEIPVACVRIPTGGGKTLMAAHAIERAARHYVGNQHAPLTLWLVPTNAIRTQTLEALKAPGHPYRDALLQHWPDERLTVIDIADCGQLRAHDFGNRAIVVVGTMQTLRVENTVGREVYAYKEDFQPHFAALPDAEFFERVTTRDLEAHPYLSPADLGKVKRSFANLLAWHRPIVISDEAHNAQSALSMEVLRRIRPACMVEWTATPARDQNVLYHVSAQVLKDAEMVKLPIVLAPHPNWKEAVRDAMLSRERLEAEAAGEAEYVRPIVLFQADAKDGEVPVDKLRAHLIEALNIGSNRIAVATGTQRELDGVNLFDRLCPVDFIITVEALKEGWDCSFAYVFCTVQTIRSAKDMEQLLGRVLRMPYAKKRKSEKLNRAYAHVCAPHTAVVAQQLTDRLVNMGFERYEAVQAIQPSLGDDLFAPAAAPIREAESVLELPLAAAQAVAKAIPTQATVSSDDGTTARLNVRGLIATDDMERAIAQAPRAARESLSQALETHQAHALVTAAPSERGEKFAALPMFALPMQGELTLFEPELLGELAGYTLAGQPADLPSFRRENDAGTYLIDVKRDRVDVRQDEPQYQLDIDAASDGISREGVLKALDKRLRRVDLLQPDLIGWAGRMVDGLLERGFELTYLARHINTLADAAATRIAGLLKDQRKTAFQTALFGSAPQARLDDNHAFNFDPARYPARWSYQGRYQFKKHFYPLPGELKPEMDAEETACAITIDRLPQIKRWVRNLEIQPQSSFWLPTSTDRFYPDFVAELEDGRLFVIEYKGGDRYSNEDSREKRDIGAVWASASSGRCVFAMVTDAKTANLSVEAQLMKAIGTTT